MSRDETGSEEVVIEEGEVGEVPAELLEEVEEEAVEETAEEEAPEEGDDAPEEPEETEPLPAPESEEEPVVRSATDEEEAAEAELAAAEAAPNEPDPPEDLGPQDLEGIITELSSEAFEKLTEIWQSRGSPRQFDYQSVRWAVYDEGTKFVRTGGQGGMDQFYGSLSVG